MSGNPTSPLLGPAETSRNQRPTSKKSTPSVRSARSRHSNLSSESTPLLSRQEEEDRPDYTAAERNGSPGSQAAISLQSLQNSLRSKGNGRSRWPTVIALSTLCLLCITIMVLGFAAPSIVEEYAKEAMVFEPTKLSIDSFTSAGVRARIQGTFVLDASRVQKKPVRDLGKAGTWIAREVESKESRVKVYLPEYGNILIGTATVPPIKVDIRNGHKNEVDFLSDLEPGEFEGLRQIANDWIDGRLGRLRIQGVANVGLKSGIFSLGTQSISESIVFEGQSLPGLPEFDITKLTFHEVKLPQGGKAMAADASISLFNEYPVKFTIPPMGFDILVPNCTPEQPYLLLADATTGEIQVTPKAKVKVDVGGIVRHLAEDLTTACPNSNSSPLDLILAQYIHGDDATVFVRGSDAPSSDTPGWISDLISGIVVPVPFPGHTFDNLIKNFSLADVHFSLPNPFADPGTPEAQPKVSAIVKAVVGLPKEMNFPLDVDHVRANADVFYHGKKLGELDLHKWQRANSTRINSTTGEPPALLVQSVVDNAPLDVTDEKVFAEVIQELVWGTKGITLGVKADVDVQTVTALGKFTVRNIPGEGKLHINPISRPGGIGGFRPKISSLEIVNTSQSSVLLKARLNFTNPTPYSATVPFVNVNILNNQTVLGHATAENVSVVPGNNSDIEVHALWEPLAASGKKGLQIGRELLSQYLSGGFNTTLTFKTHTGTIPSQPALGKALSTLELEIPTPRLRVPGEDNDDDDGDDDSDGEGGPHFIKDATMHLLTSTASFTLLSPLPKTTLYITHLNATAFYNHTLPVGTIIHDLPFAVPPGVSTSPRLPVDWDIGGVGYDAVRKALGGDLKLDAEAEVGIKIGQFQADVWFVGGGIGAKVRL